MKQILTLLALAEWAVAPPNMLGAPDVCLGSAGYSWCAATQSCERQWEVPCRDNFADCRACLAKQAQGVNLACPSVCDSLYLHEALGPDPCARRPAPPCPSLEPADGCTVTPAPIDECGYPTGCPVMHCGRELPCGGASGPECMAPFQCVHKLGTASPGVCKSPCPLQRDANGNCIEPGCGVWYDGCNTCHVSPDQGMAVCTEMACLRAGEAECRDEAPGRKGEVCYRFCEDGSEAPVRRPCAAGLVCVAPAAVGFDACGERQSRCASVPGH